MIQIDMEMPQNCKFCPLHDANPDQCPIRTIYKDDYATSRFTDCPLYKIAEDTDTISRQAVIDALQDRYKLYSWDDGGAQKAEIGRIIREIYDMPSAQPDLEEAYICGETEAEARFHAQQRWIPCSERLPEGTVLVTVETKMFKHKYICEAVWIPRWSKIADFDSWEDCSEYNEDEDEYYVLEGWYERIHNWDEYSFVGIEDKVIAWKPLPQPYNKVEKGT